MHSRPAPTGKPISVARTISILDSKLRLLAQRMKILENNMQIMARTIVSHNKKLKELEEVSGPSFTKEDIIDEVKKSLPEQAPADVSALETKVARIEERISELESNIEELNYLIKAVNPMKFVTLDQLKEAIDERLSQMKKG